MSSTSRTLRDLFFPRSRISAGPVSPQRIEGTTVYFLLRRQRAIERKQFKRTLLETVLPCWRRQAAFFQSDLALFHLATKSGLETLPFASGRSYGALKLTAMLWGMPTPPKFTSNLIPRYNAFVEVSFDRRPTQVQVYALHAAGETLKSLCEEVSTCECDRRYNVLGLPPSTGDSVYLTVITRTRWNKTREEAQRYWIREHAQLVSDNVKRTGMLGYQQVHTTLDPNSSFQNRFGGLAIIEFPNLSRYVLQAARPASLRFNNTLVLDEMNLTIQSEIGMYRRVIVN